MNVDPVALDGNIVDVCEKLSKLFKEKKISRQMLEQTSMSLKKITCGEGSGLKDVILIDS